MKFVIFSLFLCATLISMVSAFKKVKVEKVEVFEKAHVFDKSHVFSKQKAEAAGLIAGTATGILKKKTKSPKVIFKPAKIQEPKFKIKYVNVVKPVLVRVDTPKEQETLYVRHEVKTEKKTGIKFLPSFLKGFVKGKFIGKAIGKKL